MENYIQNEENQPPSKQSFFSKNKITIFIIIISALFVIIGWYYYEDYKYKKELYDKIISIENLSDLNNEVSNVLTGGRINKDDKKRALIENLVVKYATCQASDGYTFLDKELLLKDNFMYQKLILDRYNRYPTDLICPGTLEEVCKNNIVLQEHIPDSFCNSACDKLILYDNDRDKLIDEIVENKFRNWDDQENLSKWDELRTQLAYRYGGVDLYRQTCMSETTEKDREECLTRLDAMQINYKSILDEGLDFIEKTKTSIENVNIIREAENKARLERDILFGVILYNFGNRHPTDEVCPVILTTECKHNEVRRSLIPDSFCDQVCDKLIKYDQDRDLMMDEVINNNFNNWVDADKFDDYPFIRIALAHRYGGNKLINEICENSFPGTPSDCYAVVNEIYSSNDIMDLNCDDVLKVLGEVISSD